MWIRNTILAMGVALLVATFPAEAMGKKPPANPAPADDPGSELTGILHQQITAVNDGLLDGSGNACASSPSAEPGASDSEGWFYRRFWLRVRPNVTVGIPGIVKIQVIPEVELLWERQFPDGWGSYKP